jgi:hypothetical protein
MSAQSSRRPSTLAQLNPAPLPCPKLTSIKTKRCAESLGNSNRMKTIYDTPGAGGTYLNNPTSPLNQLKSACYQILPRNAHRILFLQIMYPPTPLESYSSAKVATHPRQFPGSSPVTEKNVGSSSTGFSLCPVATTPRLPRQPATASIRIFNCLITSLLHSFSPLRLPALCATLELHAA